MTIETFDELFVHQLRDAYDAEKQHTKALQKLAKQARHEELRDAFEQHLEETQGQIERLEQIFEILEERPKGQKCRAAEGLVEEAQEIVDEIDDDQLQDAAVIAAAQALEHYEISRYGTLVAWARKMGEREVVRLLQETLREEHNADQLLNQLAEQSINEEAMAVDGEEDEEHEEEDSEEEGEEERGRGSRQASSRGQASRDQGSSRGQSARSQGSGSQGSRSQPRSAQSNRSSSGGGQARQPSSQSSGNGNKRSASSNGDLKSRSYRDAQGREHHHTRSYMRGHSGKQR